MLRNPIHKRLEKFSPWQYYTFMVCLCERMYPNFEFFCLETGSSEHKMFRQLLDLVWEVLIIKGTKVNFDSQLEKLETIIPNADDYQMYAVYPAIDACVALSEAIHAFLSDDGVQHAVKVSEISLHTVAMYEMTKAGREMSDDELTALSEIEQELDIQWEIYRLLMQYTQCDTDLLKGLRAEIKEANISNIGTILS